MRAARDVFPEVGCEERKLEVLQVLLLFDGIFFIFVYLIVFIVFWGNIGNFGLTKTNAVPFITKDAAKVLLSNYTIKRLTLQNL